MKDSWNDQILEYAEMKKGTLRHYEASSAIDAHLMGPDYRGVICSMLDMRKKQGCGRGSIVVSYEFVRHTALGPNRTHILPESPDNAADLCAQVKAARDKLGSRD